MSATLGRVRDAGLARRRKLVNLAGLSFATAVTLFALFWLIWILGATLVNGFAALSPRLFTQMTPPPGTAGGLLNALVGSAIMIAVGVVIGTPVGVMAGTWLAEYEHGRPIAEIVRFINDILLSAPSIVIGLFVYELVVRQVGHFSGWAGAIALSLILLPVVVRTSEETLRLVPITLREAALALGAPKWRMVTSVLWPRGAHRDHDRHPARGGADQRRNRAAAVHRAQQPVLDRQPGQPDGQHSRRDLSVRAEPL